MSRAFLLSVLSAVVAAVAVDGSTIQGSTRVFEYGSMPNESTWAQVPLNSSTWLRFVSNFASHSQWTSVVVFFSNYTEFVSTLPLVVFKHLNSEGKLVNIQSTSRPFLPRSILQESHKTGIVYVCDTLDEDFLNKVSELDLFDSYRFWLIVKPERSAAGTTKTAKIEDVLTGLDLSLNTNMVLARVERRTPMGSPKRPETVAESTREKRDLSPDLTLTVHLVQVYKAAKTENETLTIDLGHWDIANGMFKVRNVVNEEQRWNLGGYKVQIGVKNTSLVDRTPQATANSFTTDGKAYEGKNFMEFFDCITHGINASFELVRFQRLGWRNEEGGWTHLLGGVVDETVDFALETIDVNADPSGDMSFTYAIVTTMNNIYFCRPSSGGMRDIFLAPFSPRLVLCVLSTSFLLAVAMISITVFYYRIESRPSFRILAPDNDKTADEGHDSRGIVPSGKRWKISDAVLWSVSILCMQGSQWSPKSLSGNLLVINGLLFALVIYNSFAAFITSVLSVKNVEIKDLKDLADSDFAFGYTLGNADELFLRTVNNTLLRELYFKGLRENDGVADPVTGMHRAAEGKYAFFVGARTGRRALRTVVAHEKRCQFQELYLTMTKNHASIPMRRKSLMKKIVNFKIIRLMESGILHRFQKLILLSMPSCVESTTFNSARLADVYSAFFVLGAGWVASLVALLGEALWWRKKKLRAKEKLKRNLDRNENQFYGK